MADANIDHTVYLPGSELLNYDQLYGGIGVVVYSKAFAVNGHQIRIIPNEPAPFRWVQE